MACSNNSVINWHIRKKHETKKIFICEICGKTWRSNLAIIWHIRKSIRKRKYVDARYVAWLAAVARNPSHEHRTCGFRYACTACACAYTWHVTCPKCAIDYKTFIELIRNMFFVEQIKLNPNLRSVLHALLHVFLQLRWSRKLGTTDIARVMYFVV